VRRRTRLNNDEPSKQIERQKQLATQKAQNSEDKAGSADKATKNNKRKNFPSVRTARSIEKYPVH
jgi:hypothetical protein